MMYDVLLLLLVGIRFTSPASISGSYGIVPALFGGSFGLMTPFVNHTVVLASSVSSVDNLACTPLGYVNGAIVLVDRGVCHFTVKAKNVEEAGMLLCVVCVCVCVCMCVCVCVVCVCVWFCAKLKE